MAFDIKPYEPWMKEQVAKLFSMQYGVLENYFSLLMDNFYDHPYQKEKCIRIVALEGSTVIGFQSFFYWPYILNEKKFNSYQSGNSLVHPEHRGKGIFQKLLNYFDTELQKKINIDFLMGFPVEQSKNSFLRNNWNNILDMQWYMNIINPFALFFPKNQSDLLRKFTDTDKIIEESERRFHLAKSKDFIKWRKHYSQANQYYHFSFEEKNKKIIFELKLSTRKKLIHELTIGNIQTNTDDENFIFTGFDKLKSKVFSCGFISFLSIALNEKSSSPILNILHKSGYKKVNRQIHFIVKSFIDIPEITDPSCWILYRGDIDTW